LHRSIAALIALAVSTGSFVALLAPTTSGTPGDLVGDVVVPVTSSIGVSIAFDGTRFWYTNYYDADQLHAYTVSCVGPACTSTLSQTLFVHDSIGRPVQAHALSFDVGRGLLWTSAGDGAVWTIDPATGLATKRFDLGCCASLIDGLAYDGTDDSVWLSEDASHILRHYSATGAVIETITVSSLPSFPQGCGNSGIAVGGDYLYLGTAHCGVIYRWHRASNAGETFATPGGRDEDLECDTVTFAPRAVMWSKDAYNNHVTAIEIESGTCGIGGFPPCGGTLDVALIDPAPGFDYLGGSKIAQSPPLGAPRVSGTLTLRATATGSAGVAGVTFFVDGNPIGTDATAPYEIAWDSTTVPGGAHVITASARDLDNCPTSVSQPVVAVCGTPVDVAIARPAIDTNYRGDVAYPGSGTPVVIGDLTVRAWASDPGRIASVTWSENDAPFATSLAGPDFAALWPASASTAGPRVLAAKLRETDPRCVHEVSTIVSIADLDREAVARAVFATTAQPAEPVVRSRGATLDGPDALFHAFTHAAADVRADTLEDRTQRIEDERGSGARALSRIENVTLLGGRITVEVLRAEAEALFSHEAFDTIASDTGTLVAGVVVDGTAIPDPVAPGTKVAVPGVGTLVLHETVVVRNGSFAEIAVRGLHLYANVNGLRSEVILAHAVAGVDIGGHGFAGEVHAIDPQDDAGTGGDVGGTPASAHELALGLGGTDHGVAVVGGRLTTVDRADAYKVMAREGEKIVVTLTPSTRAHVTTQTFSFPAVGASATVDHMSLPDPSVSLLQPVTNDAILVSDAPLSAPERLELNVDRDGHWTILIELDGGQEANYTLSVSVTPLVFAPDAPRGDYCRHTAAPVLAADDVVVNVMRSTTDKHVYKLFAAIGDDVAVTLTPGDADGQDFDLYVYDRACKLLTWSVNGKSVFWPGDVPKGVPEAAAILPALYTGEYWIEVRRFIGVGNYVLTVHDHTVIPTVPGNDAGTGADASNSEASPTVLAEPQQGAWQGRFEDLDPKDVYAMDLRTGERLVVTLAPSPANTMRLTLKDAWGATLTTTAAPQTGSGSAVLYGPAPAPMRVLLVVEPVVGGGNYVFTVTHA